MSGRGLTLVTGASGLVGQHVVRRLLKEGYGVRAMLMPGDGAKTLSGLEIERVEGDILKPETLPRAMKGCRFLFHIAATTLEWAKDRRLIYNINVQGPRNVHSAALAAGIERAVHVSSCAAIGSATDPDHPADEETIYDHWDVDSPYFHSKLLGEKEAMQWALRGLDLVIVNPHQVIGAGDAGPSVTGGFLLKFARGQVPFYIDAWTNWIDARALAWGMVRALEKGRKGERYILAGPPIHVRDMLELMEKITGKKAPTLMIPQPVIAAGAFVMESIAEHVTHQTPMVSVGMAQVLKKTAVVSHEKARRELGFEPPYIEEAIRLALDWFRKEGML